MEPNSEGSKSDWVIPDYSGACLSNLLPALAYRLAKERSGDSFPTAERLRNRAIRQSGIDPAQAAWISQDFSGFRQLIVLVIDGLGHAQLMERIAGKANLERLRASLIRSVAPSTTASALTSITTGLPPSQHGVLGYRMRVGPSEVLNTLRWSTETRSSNWDLSARKLAPVEPFLGLSPAVVTKALFDNSGFSVAHLRGSRSFPWRTQSGIVSWIEELVLAGEPLIYAYYEGIDTTAHEFGLAGKFDRELDFLDFTLGRLLDLLPVGVGIAVTADHGQVEVLEAPLLLPDDVRPDVIFQSGEGRFRWLHVRSGRLESCVARLKESFLAVARVMTREEVLSQGLLGPEMSQEMQRRLGDVALIATGKVAFFDPADTGPFKLVARHGALTSDEMEVPLLTFMG